MAGADVSSWLFVGGGPSWLRQGSDAELELAPSLQIQTGMGTPPSRTIVLGGLGTMQTHFGHGTDLGLALRIATHGFVNGDWGAALDLGGYQRWWGEGSTGGTAALVLGAPWGITLGLNGSMGTNDHLGYSGVLGIDLARLTVYRRSGQSWLKNPFPAYRPKDER